MSVTHTSATAVSVAILIATLARPAEAQWTVTDPALTARNSFIAFLKEELLETLTLERDRLKKMATRLSALTRLDRYSVQDIPLWRTHDVESDAVRYSAGYQAALNFGDASGAQFDRIARARVRPDTAILHAFPALGRASIAAGLATLDAADSALITATHDTGSVRFAGRRETAAIDALQATVIDPSSEQSVTAVLEKINAATLLETRQKQGRLLLLGALAEQLIVDQKRSRDTEVSAMNMQLGHLREAPAANARFLAGAADDLRHWRQP
jgi:hypothetical protein